MSHVSFRIDLTQLNRYLFTLTSGPCRRRHYRALHIGFSPFWIRLKNGFRETTKINMKSGKDGGWCRAVGNVTCALCSFS